MLLGVGCHGRQRAHLPLHGAGQDNVAEVTLHRIQRLLPATRAALPEPTARGLTDQLGLGEPAAGAQVG